MPLTIGARLGPYEIVAPIGAGGMGEVYRARDAKLGRDVAIKILPDLFLADPERVARFDREAQALASLNHPNIAIIHGFEESSVVKALVLELVEGPTLAEKLAHVSTLKSQGSGTAQPSATSRTPSAGLPVDEALHIARQIADALEAAHDRGIIHRDLKPSNIKVRSDGAVKVLDFGLARFGAGWAGEAGRAGGAGGEFTQSPTLTTPAGTMAGMILGTAAYMAPEQARGKVVDKRADIWAFGCVLFEMLTGARAFGGDEITDTLAFIITKEASWAALPADTPPGIRRLLRRCLEKDPKRRLHDIADARIEIDEAMSGASIESVTTATPPISAPSRERLAWGTAGALALLLVVSLVGAVFYVRHAIPEPLVTRLAVITPRTTDSVSFALSHDGRQIAFESNADGVSKLWVRRLDQTTARPLPGTEEATYPFWAPDGGAIGFFANGKLKRIDLAGGGPQVLADAPVGRGGAWNRDGVILFTQNTTSGLVRVSASGGTPGAVTRVAPGQNSHRWPQFLPDGRHFLFTLALGETSTRGVALGSLDGGEPIRVLQTETGAMFAPPDHLLFVNQGVLMARHFDPASGVVSGEPVPVAPEVGADSTTARAAFSVSANGVLAHRPLAGQRRQFQWVDRSGKVLGTAGAPDEGAPSSPELSPDGRRIAMYRSGGGNIDVWLMETDRGVLSRFTLDAANDASPAWSPDGRRIAFRSNRNGTHDLFEKPAGGTGDEQPMLVSQQTKVPNDWSPDGRVLLYVAIDPKTGADIWALPVSAPNESKAERKPFVVVQTPFEEASAQFSPDGRWIAYESNESGRFEVYVRPFPGPGGRWQASVAGGRQPRWGRDGKELFYLAPDARLTAVTVRPTPDGQAVEVSAAVALFQTRLATSANVIASGGLQRTQYAVAKDGRFLLNSAIDEGNVAPISVVLNWPSVLKSRE